DLRGAALAARGGQVRSQPPELLPFLARVELDAGDPGIAQETLALVPPGPLFRKNTALALTVALRRDIATKRKDSLTTVVEKVTSSGAAEDPGLPVALDAFLANGRTAECDALLAWLE